VLLPLFDDELGHRRDGLSCDRCEVSAGRTVIEEGRVLAEDVLGQVGRGEDQLFTDESHLFKWHGKLALA
jgi:hypothetical protein